jgi:hypothetical protein
MGKPMSEARRYRRLLKKKNVKTINMGEDRELKIPTERDVEKYITEKMFEGFEFKNKDNEIK